MLIEITSSNRNIDSKNLFKKKHIKIENKGINKILILENARKFLINSIFSQKNLNNNDSFAELI